MWESIVVAGLAATVRIAVQVVAWRRELTRERERRRLILAALRLAGHGVRLEERRPDGGVLTVRGEGLAASRGQEGEEG
ncbi:hypothetical protein QFZ66_008338 [Streptomyces sp. B4I13]|uniref:Uncharacterized protein n=1 Tax=Streptomyces achromogenes TaxID=67255 RepID=A0ABU0QCW9_STRAH|nr:MULTISPECIES: hypothetical protein [Streptomyces]MDQ0688508.1 hypothetical protein [Streptomyces achromogenes]MDQ0835701.1 hypothetical protein [Streptomyces achromogenes]MDQ0964460.1 hypothetical protein [Streptomyces sp. B4I13]